MEPTCLDEDLPGLQRRSAALHSLLVFRDQRARFLDERRAIDAATLHVRGPAVHYGFRRSLPAIDFGVLEPRDLVAGVRCNLASRSVGFQHDFSCTRAERDT